MAKQMFSWIGTNNKGEGGQEYTSSVRIKDNADGTQSVIVGGEGVGGKMVWKITPDSLALEGVTDEATVRVQTKGDVTGLRFSGESVGGSIFVDGVDSFEFVKGANKQNIDSDIAAVEEALIALGILPSDTAPLSVPDVDKGFVAGLSPEELAEVEAFTGYDFPIG